MLEQTDSDAPPVRTIERIVPVTVPYEFELEMRDRAESLGLPLEDVLSECVAVIPDCCFSPVEEHPERDARRMALHTTVEPELAARVDQLAADERDWIREAVKEKAAREQGTVRERTTGAASTGSGP